VGRSQSNHVHRQEHTDIDSIAQGVLRTPVQNGCDAMNALQKNLGSGNDWLFTQENNQCLKAVKRNKLEILNNFF
jgi:hypothetical protein